VAGGSLSFPFRLTPTGAAATVVRGSNAEIDEAIAVLALTVIGERPMRPGFGVPDPGFGGLHLGDIQVGLDAHGPQGVTVTGIKKTPINDTYEVDEITWSRGEEGNG
jgi:hypothetical protein